MDDVGLTPIGIYRSSVVNPYEAGRQPRENDDRPGEIRLNPEHASVADEVAGSERIWIVFQFDRNSNWKPMVRPPRGAQKKLGVFATRAPYRPNPIGLSCVRLIAAQGAVLRVEGADLLDGTPVFSVKPYVPETDALEDARAGWLEGIDERKSSVTWTENAREKLQLLEELGVDQLSAFAVQQLEFEPFDRERKRVRPQGDAFVLAYRTWRIHFRETAPRALEIFDLASGYSDQELLPGEDRWGDKNVHREFLRRYPRAQE